MPPTKAPTFVANDKSGPQVKKEPTGPIVRRQVVDRLVPPPRSRTSRTDAQDLLSTISSVLDPSAQASRDEARAERSFQTTQYLAMTQQLRETNAALESLHGRLQDSEQDRQAAERRADKAELMAMFKGHPSDNYYHHNAPLYPHGRHHSPHPSQSSHRNYHLGPDSPDREQPRYLPRTHHRNSGRVRREIYYADGGKRVTWDDADVFHTPSPGTRVVQFDDEESPVGIRRPSTPPPSQPRGNMSEVFHARAPQDPEALAMTLTPARGGQKILVTVTPQSVAGPSHLG